MKIETLNDNWKPIVVTIETREEAQELYSHMVQSSTAIVLLKDLYLKIGDML